LVTYLNAILDNFYPSPRNAPLQAAQRGGGTAATVAAMAPTLPQSAGSERVTGAWRKQNVRGINGLDCGSDG
jgi:hypothetical protein